MRTMVGLNQWFGGLDCNFSIPSEAEVRTVLQMSYQERKIEVNFANGSTNIDEMIPIGEFEVNRGLSLLPLYENSNLPGQSFSPCVQCTCQNIGKHTWLIVSRHWCDKIQTHSVEISGFFYHSDFTWNQFWGFLKCKICYSNTFRGSEFWFYEFLHFLKAEIFQMNKNESHKNGKNGSFRTSRFSEIDFTQNINDRKILKFPHYYFLK